MPNAPTLQHAVIVAHPDPKSLCLELAQAYAHAAHALGQQCIVRDLYRVGFDPCLKAEEIPGPDGYHCAPDTQHERDLIGEAKVFAFVYPFWFNAPPAILKGYVDRVFSMGFGYEPRPGGNEPLLDGKQLISISTSGAPDHWVKSTGALDALNQGFDRHVAGVCGLTVVDHLHFGGVVPGITPGSVRQMLKAVRDAVTRAFDPAHMEGVAP
ncbi:MAG: NAD(P)H-dependent oxidoreductase [Proteobacteria bacterium]|nr:NAD(P)H-dependent oxidoreductase [Pseudomonadota bacterium]